MLSVLRFLCKHTKIYCEDRHDGFSAGYGSWNSAKLWKHFVMLFDGHYILDILKAEHTFIIVFWKSIHDYRFSVLNTLQIVFARLRFSFIFKMKIETAVRSSHQGLSNIDCFAPFVEKIKTLDYILFLSLILVRIFVRLPDVFKRFQLWKMYYKSAKTQTKNVYDKRAHDSVLHQLRKLPMRLQASLWRCSAHGLTKNETRSSQSFSRSFLCFQLESLERTFTAFKKIWCDGMVLCVHPYNEGTT